ncbi:hypothetical protein BHE74_00034520 [Ensete ventricosum]|nr:hypothetical protein BHE74_00034520 [Ensete ventricosum]
MQSKLVMSLVAQCIGRLQRWDSCVHSMFCNWLRLRLRLPNCRRWRRWHFSAPLRRSSIRSIRAASWRPIPRTTSKPSHLLGS